MTTHSSAPPGRLSAVKKGAMALAAGALLGLGSGAANAVETTFIGYTNGCFGLACMPAAVSGPQSVTLAPGLTYNNSTFNAMTSGGFLSLGSNGGMTPAGNFNNLGSFSLGSSLGSYVGQAFDLLVTFTAPFGTTPGSQLFTSVITGSVLANNAGGVFLNFENSAKHFTFANGGSFDFFVNDVSVNPGGTIGFSGTIIAAAVPEPETYALFMAGLAALGFMARRRKV
ncbi:MAG: PEP-CTERM sorting domain-containing protein [Pseudomonadota bacterium]|nr:PEP-CTERM sorting domain-containing protein [Pseudomonadota bacterium]